MSRNGVPAAALFGILILGGTRWVAAADAPTTLQQLLVKEGAGALAQAVREKGDASRGAVVFYRPDLACTRCHSAGEDSSRLGPDLARAGTETPDIYLIESVLLPSKVIKKGYETITITTVAGKTVSGLLAEERPGAVVLRNAAKDGQPVTILKKDIDERHDNGPSPMPEGLVNVLSDRQEFLDLARFLLEIVQGGPERARQLRPAASLFAPPPLPDYERDLDHAGFIRSLNAQSFERGRTIYTRVCASCHGTRKQVGSMPTSLRFAEGAFKNGSDPYSLYQTLTHGYGMMTPQAWMVPEQKYDVIHYLREAYLKPHNPTQYAKLDDAYLASLPKGTKRGPKASNLEPRWYEFQLDNKRTVQLYQQGIYAPDDCYRWMPSPAIDASGNIGIGYSFGGPSHFPGQRFAGRLSDDPLGVLTLRETVLVEGEAAQTYTNRWQDYTQTAVDPSDDRTIWYVGDYVKQGATSYSTRIGAFRLRGANDGKPTVTPIPEAVIKKFNLDTTFYKKHLDYKGYSILSSAKVSDAALLEARYLIDKLLGNREDILKAMIKRGCRFMVMAPTEMTTDVPEQRYMKKDTKTNWDRRARGLGGKLSSCGEENLLNLKGDRYRQENILIHEFNHAIHEQGLREVDPSFDGRLQRIYEEAMAKGLWKGMYPATNRNEYWAEGAQAYFDCMRPQFGANTREKLEKYDNGLFKLVDDVYKQSKFRYVRYDERNLPAPPAR